MNNTTIKSALLSSLLFSCQSPKPEQHQETNVTDTPQVIVEKKETARPAHWSYSGDSGPDSWGKLSPVYDLCSNGKQQSPIDIKNSQVAGAVSWSFNYASTSLKIAHNEHMDDIIDDGHTIQVSVEEGSTFNLNNRLYHLKQFHFHTPSEHTIDGKHFPMEIHFVHQSDSGNLAVVSSLIKEGAKNPNFEKIIANMPEKKGDSKHLTEINLSLQFHLPKTNEAYYYLGSLTTPPCTEQVEWLVLKHHAEASADQIKAFTEKIGPNNRPIQMMHDRKIEMGNFKGNVKN